MAAGPGGTLVLKGRKTWRQVFMEDTRFIMAGCLIDGSGGALRKNVFLAVRDGLIAAIGPAADLPRTSRTAVDDFSHCVIVPALVDCSVSLARSPAVDQRVRLSAAEASPGKKAALLAQHIRYCHGHGVLGVADGDDPDGLVARHREEAAQGDIITIRTAGHDGAGGSRPAGDFLKIRYSPDSEVGEGPAPRLSHTELCRLLRRRGGRRAVVVANGPQQVAEALEAGCDAIEQGYAMGEDNLRKMAETGVLWIPSVVRAKNGLDGAGGGGDVACRFSQRYVAPGKPIPGAEAFWQKLLAGQLALLRLAREQGVMVAVGTGAGTPGILHGESMVEEMKLFIRAGYTLAETIRCASVNGAAFFGMDKLGLLGNGRPATFLIARGTVQQLPRKLSYLEGIYIDGAPSRLYRKQPVMAPLPTG